jgi:hypothetical protein
MSAEMLRRAVNHALRWLYGHHEVAIFSASPWEQGNGAAGKVDVRTFPGNTSVSSLPPLRPDVRRMLLRRLAMGSLAGDVFCLLLADGCGVGFGWVRESGAMAIEEIGLTLMLQLRQICFFDFFLDPDIRGRGLYTKFLRSLRGIFRDRSILIYSESWNVASLAGISAAGFKPLASVRGTRLCGLRFPTAMRVHPPGGDEARPPQRESGQ